jgi:hypothetical protein
VRLTARGQLLLFGVERLATDAPTLGYARNPMGAVFDTATIEPTAIAVQVAKIHSDPLQFCRDGRPAITVITPTTISFACIGRCAVCMLWPLA